MNIRTSSKRNRRRSSKRNKMNTQQVEEYEQNLTRTRIDVNKYIQENAWKEMQDGIREETPAGTLEGIYAPVEQKPASVSSAILSYCA